MYSDQILLYWNTIETQQLFNNDTGQQLKKQMLEIKEKFYGKKSLI